MSWSQAILNNAFDSIVTIDEHHSVLEWNRMSETMFGWKREEVMGKKLFDLLIPKDMIVSHQAGLKRFMRTGIPHIIDSFVQVNARKKDDTLFPVMLSLSHVQDGDKHFFTAIMRDLTEQIQKEEGMKESERKALKASHYKTQFLANTSHEIRTPINGILGLAHLLADDPTLSSEQKGCVDLIVSSGEHLLSIVNDVLDLVKVEEGRIELEILPFDPSDLLKRVEKLFLIPATAKGIELEFILPKEQQFLLGDQGRLWQVVANLVNNAVKFTMKGKVKVTCKIVEDDEGEGLFSFSLQVSDSGIGITQEHIERLYIPFTQADVSTTRQFGGSGLGLSITKHLVELMQGTIQVESQIGRGSTFTVILALPPSISVQIPTISKCNYLLSPKDTDKKFTDRGRHRILIVEDNPIK